MAAPSDILVVAEAADGALASHNYEVLGLARRLADGGGGAVAAVLFGEDANGLAPDLIAHGADSVHVADGGAFATYQAEAWLPDLAAIAKETSPVAILMGHTAMGADLSPRLAFRLETAVATGCVEAEISGGRLLLTRPCYGGNGREVTSFRTTPAIATVKVKSQEPATPDGGRRGDVVAVASVLDPGDIRVRIVGREAGTTGSTDLEQARVIVAGGRGLKSRDGFALAHELAEVLGGAVGASRLPCDFGWCPPSYQIGLSGRIVSPDLYLALGISGAPQHIAGCASARAIVSVNTDRAATIFGHSRFGVIGDCQEVVPALIAEIRKIKG
ncbi:MAG: electron transfer flavoprotein subunit alpha/FixB family protein [Rhodospirillales bacterium]|jgi:electron transfer flavoprotein alpha subunit|nr:electron transfer flavoprotein subunit alpha/FixB family protein [Rhodospirillales bacterium]MDP6774865.1 electron transfer flavoprotein subunit alpha/FixB family protein [Rhodospirillales bacterium]